MRIFLGILWVFFGTFCVTGLTAADADGSHTTLPFIEAKMQKNPRPASDYIDDPYPENICAAALLHFRNGRTLQLKPCPAWKLSPDKNYAALDSHQNERGLFIVDMDSGTLKRHILLESGPKCGSFVWSPDSQYVAFTVINPNYPSRYFTKLLKALAPVPRSGRAKQGRTVIKGPA